MKTVYQIRVEEPIYGFDRGTLLWTEKRFSNHRWWYVCFTEDMPSGYWFWFDGPTVTEVASAVEFGGDHIAHDYTVEYHGKSGLS